MDLKKIAFIKFIVLVLVFIIGCNTESTVYKEYQKFESLSWNRFNILKFEVPVEDISSTYDIYLALRHIPEFPNKTILINYTLNMPSGDMRTNDKELELIDRDGNRLSECLGDLCDIEFQLRKGIRFSEQGSLVVEIENKYTKVEMPGIMEVGIIMRKSVKE
ncbi:MAG: gliding motility lipoprotein GldH [Bacteroidales bacterium]|nr:gliding motility lipoprotein GldH [Bacteroidales bacterium]